MPERDQVITAYARALFAIAEAEGTLDDVEQELYRFGKIVESQPELREALTDPALPGQRKGALLEELLGSRASRHTVAVLRFVLDQGRSKDIPRIAAAMAGMAAGRHERVLAEVRTVVPLDGDRRERLVRALERATGREVELRATVDPEIVGGVVARVGDQVFDGSIRRKLELAREQLARVR